MNEKVICPWCGEEMVAVISKSCHNSTYCGEYQCNSCLSRAPFICFANTFERAEEAAYAAATHRPENRPLTVAELPKLTIPCWIDRGKEYHEPCLLSNHSAGCYKMEHKYGQGFLYSNSYGKHWLAWLIEPTPADIESARNQ